MERPLVAALPIVTCLLAKTIVAVQGIYVLAFQASTNAKEKQLYRIAAVNLTKDVELLCGELDVNGFAREAAQLRELMFDLDEHAPEKPPRPRKTKSKRNRRGS